MLKSEIDEYYLTSVKHVIVDYILLDENEKDRLSIDHCPEFYQPMAIRTSLEVQYPGTRVRVPTKFNEIKIKIRN